MSYIRHWYRIEDDKKYIVFARYAGEELRLYDPEILLGWQVKRLCEGVYVAVEFVHPTKYEDCE